MRTTLTLDDKLLADAEFYTGIREKSALIREALKALVEREAARRLARLGGSEPGLKKDPAAAAKARVILVDTSVWIDHLRSASAILSELLGDGEVLGHPFVLGEVALGNLRRRGEILRMLRRLPQANSASHREVLQFVDREALFGRGIGYVDAHLLAAARLTAGTKLWTRDHRLQAVAAQLGLAAALSH